MAGGVDGCVGVVRFGRTVHGLPQGHCIVPNVRPPRGGEGGGW